MWLVALPLVLVYRIAGVMIATRTALTQQLFFLNRRWYILVCPVGQTFKCTEQVYPHQITGKPAHCALQAPRLSWDECPACSSSRLYYHYQVSSRHIFARGHFWRPPYFVQCSWLPASAYRKVQIRVDIVERHVLDPPHLLLICDHRLWLKSGHMSRFRDFPLKRCGDD